MKNKFILMLACLLTAGAWFTPPYTLKMSN